MKCACFVVLFVSRISWPDLPAARLSQSPTFISRCYCYSIWDFQDPTARFSLIQNGLVTSFSDYTQSLKCRRNSEPRNDPSVRSCVNADRRKPILESSVHAYQIGCFTSHLNQMGLTRRNIIWISVTSGNFKELQTIETLRFLLLFCSHTFVFILLN